ncbi:hypothetical protein AAMO2058_000718600 [Amorphochlora amoebiformis]
MPLPYALGRSSRVLRPFLSIYSVVGLGSNQRTPVMSSLNNQIRNQMEAEPFWNNFWTRVEKGTFFDTGTFSPPLKNALKDLPQGRALVPGCGRGYDALLLSEGKKRYVVGMDISETAIKEAQAERREMKVDAKQVEFILGDFFKYEPDQSFDVIFDYTFLCAIPPPLRESWAKQMASLITPETGRLVTLIFPIVDKSGGPPYAMSIKLVTDLVKSVGFELVQLDEKPESYKKRRGMEALAIWKLSKKDK